MNELDRLAQISIKDGLLSVKSRDDDSDVTEEFLSTRGKPKKGVSIEQQARIAILWMLHRQKITNEKIRELLGLNEKVA